MVAALIALQFAFIAPNIMTKQKGKGYQGIGGIDEAFEYENTRSDFKCCNYQEQCKKYVRLPL